MAPSSCPIPPILIEAVGRGKEAPAQETLAAIKEAAVRAEAARPDLVMLLTPHGAYDPHVVRVNGAETLYGSMGDFGAPEVNLRFQGAHQEGSALLLEAQRANLPLVADSLGGPLDHGAFVPLWFLAEVGLK